MKEIREKGGKKKKWRKNGIELKVEWEDREKERNGCRERERDERKVKEEDNYWNKGVTILR